jgi:hypothetical protein
VGIAQVQAPVLPKKEERKEGREGERKEGRKGKLINASEHVGGDGERMLYTVGGNVD